MSKNTPNHLQGVQVLFIFLSLSITSTHTWANESNPTPPLPALDDEGQAELLQYKENLKNQITPLNRLNPLSPDFNKNQAPTPGISQISDQLQQLSPRIEELLKNPSLQGILRISSDPDLANKTKEILNHPDRLRLIYAQMGWLIFFFLFRTWRSSKLSHGQWIRSLWLKFWTLLLYVTVTGLIIPGLILGDLYKQWLTLAYHAAFR